MELCRLVVDGLTFAAGNSIIEDNVFEALIQQSFKVLLDNSSEWTPEELTNTSNAGIIKQCFAAIMSFILEAARTDSPAVSSQLEDCQWDEIRISTFVKLYELNKAKIQATLSRYGHHPPHIVNTKWRQDYIVKNNWMSKVGQLDYLIQLETEHAGESDVVNFSCTLEELQILVDKLREASKCLTKQAQL